MGDKALYNAFNGQSKCVQCTIYYSSRNAQSQQVHVTKSLCHEMSVTKCLVTKSPVTKSLYPVLTYTLESPKTDTLRSGQPLPRTNPVARIEFAKHVILKQSPRSGQLRISINGQATGPEWRVLMQYYLPRTDNQKLHLIIFMDITNFTW